MEKENLGEKKLKKMCLCPACPTYVNCKELIFCILGKSKCIKQEKGCLCPGCPVQIKMGFKNISHCTRGNEKEQLKK